MLYYKRRGEGVEYFIKERLSGTSLETWLGAFWL